MKTMHQQVSKGAGFGMGQSVDVMASQPQLGLGEYAARAGISAVASAAAGAAIMGTVAYAGAPRKAKIEIHSEEEAIKMKKQIDDAVVELKAQKAKAEEKAAKKAEAEKEKAEKEAAKAEK